MADVAIHTQAIELRKKGYSYNYISQKLGVSKGTLHYWLAPIPFKPNKETILRIGRAKLKSALFKNRQKLFSIREARKFASEDIGVITRRDIFMLGIGLYIGEGGKSGHIIRIINSNPKIINLALRWFRDICGLRRENFSIAIHLYPDNNLRETLDYWSRVTAIPVNQFGKTQIDKRKNKKMFKRGKLPYGTAHLTIKSNGRKEHGVQLFRRIIAWMDEVFKQTKFARVV